MACQRRTGSAYGIGAYFPVASVMVSGASSVFQRVSDAGRWLRMHFCPDCGSTLFWEAELRPGVLGVAVGMFEAPEDLRPTVAVFARHRWPWAPLPEDLTVHDTYP
jgi:hypothetical protein